MSSSLKRPSRAIHTPAEFRSRVLRFALFGIGIVLGSLLLGVVGYRVVAGFGWVDALHGSAMILSGMGPVAEMPDDGAKVFDSLFALYGGAVYPAVTALVLYPVLHRMMNLLHIASLGEEGAA